MTAIGSRSLGCAVAAVWLLSGASGVWALFVGLANTSTQGYVMSKSAVLLAFSPGVITFVLASPCYSPRCADCQRPLTNHCSPLYPQHSSRLQ